MNSYPRVEIILMTEINGKEYDTSVDLNLEKVTEETLRHSLIGEIGMPFRFLIMSAMRAKAREAQGGSL